MSVVQTVSMIFDKPKAAIGQVILDVAISETHTLQTRATEHPVESGCNMIDHIQILPDSIQLDGIISNTPTAFLGTTFFDSGNYADEAFRQLEELMKSGQPVQIVTSLKTYRDMALENLTIKRTAANSDALCFSCSAKQIRMVESKIINIPKPKVKRAQPKKSLGKQPATEVSEATSQQTQSYLFSLF
ncbi:MAG: phage baseplate protein [Myxococcaceae bacterium]